jgi:hypothetical protein
VDLKLANALYTYTTVHVQETQSFSHFMDPQRALLLDHSHSMTPLEANRSRVVLLWTLFAARALAPLISKVLSKTCIVLIIYLYCHNKNSTQYQKAERDFNA